MYVHFDGKLNREVFFIHPGEYFASNNDIVIGTLLGSCISVALVDPENRIGGLNHFLLPASMRNDTYLTKSGKYGLHAMELIINEIMKLGGSKTKLYAKVFGGGSVIPVTDKNRSTVSQRNIEFVFDFLRTEEIRIVSSDVGGEHARKIFFFPRTGKILLKRIINSKADVLEKYEGTYIRRLTNE